MSTISRLINAMHVAICLSVVAPQAAVPQSAADIAGPSAFQSSLAAAGPGQVLSLAGGDYGAVSVRHLAGSADQPVIIRSVDPADPARFSALTIQDSEHLVFEGLVLKYTFTPGDPPQTRPFQVLGSSDITIRQALFEGDVARNVSPAADGFGTGFGLVVSESSGITVENCEFRTFLRGLVVGRSRDIVLRGNDIHSLRSDGMNFAQVESVLIEGNHIHDFLRALDSADHPDMIQFWTNGTTSPSRDIVIRDNVLNSGMGRETQSIFMRNDLVDRGLAGYEMYYRDILITENVIINAHLAGIAVGATDGLTISNNTVIRNAHSAAQIENVSVSVPRISVSNVSKHVQILRNVTNFIVGYENQTDWIFADNLYVQDQGRLAQGLFYDRVFVEARTGNPQNLASFSYLPDGPLDGTGLGAGRLASLHPTLPSAP